MSHYAKILKADIANGIGFRVTIFLTGCPIRCKGCFNRQLWDKEVGKEFNDETVEKLRKELEDPNCSGLSILGGEPLADWNLDATARLIDLAHMCLKDVWLWTRLLHRLPF
jgi:anaerobic ribonucleoside-triphosphate reductase activating protein